MKVIRFTLSIPLMLLVGIAGAMGTFSLFLAFAIYELADWVYGGRLAHDVTSSIMSPGDKRALPTD